MLYLMIQVSYNYDSQVTGGWAYRYLSHRLYKSTDESTSDNQLVTAKYLGSQELVHISALTAYQPKYKL